MENSSRLYSFDNLRTLMVVFVVMFHSTMSYTFVAPFWPYKEAQLSEILELVPLILDVFMMLIFFFISGYFALSDLKKKGVKDFLKSKLKRIGIPLIIGILVVLPILDYINYFYSMTTESMTPLGFMEYWYLSILKVGEFNVGLLEMDSTFFMIDQFYMRYLWFLSELFLFYAIFSLIYVINKKIQVKSAENKPKEGKPTMKLFVIFGIIVSIWYFIWASVLPNELAFFSLGNIIQFQLSRLGMFIGCFLLGSHANSRKWFDKNNAPTSPKKAGIVTLLILVGMILVGRIYFRDPYPSPILTFAFSALYSFLGLSFLVYLVSLSLKRWNTTSNIKKHLSENSYNMYLLHYIPVMILPLLLSGIAIPGELKFVIVFVATIIISYGISQYMLKPINLRLKSLQSFRNK